MKDSKPPTPPRKPLSPKESGPPNVAGDLESWLKTLPKKVVEVRVELPKAPTAPHPRERIEVHSLEELVVELRKHVRGDCIRSRTFGPPPVPRRRAIEDGYKEVSIEPVVEVEGTSSGNWKAAGTDHSRRWRRLEHWRNTWLSGK
jgi:hypothetical protein